MRRIVVGALVVAIGVGRASADPAPKPRDRRIAQVLSGVGTAVSAGLVLSGFMFTPDNGQEFDRPLLYAGIATAVVTPSFGEWYGGEFVTYGMAARVFGAGLATAALTWGMTTGACDDTTVSGRQCTSMTGAGMAVMGLAAIAFVGGMAYDVRDAGPSVDRWNASHGFTVSVAPTAMMTASWRTVPGLALAGEF